MLSEQVYKDKVLACWIGKNIGGTVGAPMEFIRQKNVIDGYGKTFDHPMPNDDLDLQILWLIALEEKGNNLTSERLCEYWQRYVTPHWGEYGIAKVNMKSGLLPPMSGTCNNHMFKHSNGAWIRSEIWACLAPGRPDVAVQYAVKDAIIDHGNGEGSYAEVFMAALQSCAFYESDLAVLLDIALSYIPADCGVARAVRDAADCCQKGMTLDEIRFFLLKNYCGAPANPGKMSEEDKENGFDQGPIGYDAPLNVGIVVAGLMYGGNCFDKVIKSTIYFGEDTDCTVGTAASTYGLIYGSARIEPEWREPIGDRINTGCLNLGELGVYGDILPQTVGEFTDRVFRQYQRLGDEIAGSGALNQKAGAHVPDMMQRYMNTTSFTSDFYSVFVDYITEDCRIEPSVPRTVRITVSSEYKTADILNLRWILPDEMTVSPKETSKLFLMFKGFEAGEKTLEFTFTADCPPPVSRALLEITIDGRTTCLYVPVVFYCES